MLHKQYDIDSYVQDVELPQSDPRASQTEFPT